MNIKLTLAYDGTAYFGWQNSGCGAAIETVLQMVLEKILQQKIVLQAASRTDAGVHAEGQIANFLLKKEINLERLHKSINQLLPTDIRVNSIEVAKDHFHPTLDATGKEYHYRLSYSKIQSPFERFFSWHYPFPLDLEKMRAAARLFIGQHDFQAFGNVTHSNSQDTIRILYRLDIVARNAELCFKIHGNHFLYKMVRNLVGTLVYVGTGKLSLTKAATLIASQDRTLGGITAPAHGLLLKKVFYV